MKETEGRTVKIEDLPGHRRFRASILEMLPRAAAVVLVVDSAWFLAAGGSAAAAVLRDASELLFDVLTHPSVADRPGAGRASRPFSVLIAVNKCEGTDVIAGAAERAKLALEKEL